MKIAIYHPQLNNFGGGETVALTIANALSKDNQVDIFTPYQVNKKNLEKFFCLDLSNINIKKIGNLIHKLPTLNSAKSSILLRGAYKRLEKYDLVIDTATNGWFDKKLKTKTICYIHFPFFYPRKEGIKKIIDPLIIHPENAFKYDKILCNSNFTKRVVSKMTNKKIEVVYPPVKVEKIEPRKKKNRIVTIGRFSYEKKHEIMIDAFKELYKQNKDYTFHIIGSFQKNVKIYKKDYRDILKEKAKGYPIEFHSNMPHDNVLKFLEKSKIYWHARGYGETNLNEYENFGITTVEAMAAGSVPIVINLGAQPEIVEHDKNGFYWDKPKELIKYTLSIINSPKTNKRISSEARKRSLKYDNSIFIERIKNVIGGMI